MDDYVRGRVDHSHLLRRQPDLLPRAGECLQEMLQHTPGAVWP